MSNKKLYRYYLTVTNADGSKKRLVFSSANAKEAKKKRDIARLQYEAGLLTFSGKTTVAKYAETFANQNALNIDDLSRLNRLLVQNIGYMALEAVKPTNIRACYAELEGLSKSTVSKGCAIINRFFETAVADELILRNPCKLVPRPKHKEFIGRRSMTEQEEKLFLDVLRQRIGDGKHQYDIAWGIMYACGLRPGEVRALMATDIKYGQSPEIHVSRACKGKGREIGPPKTAAGVRDVPIPAWFAPLLRQAAPKDSLYLFPATDGGPVSHQTFMRRWHSFYRAMQIAAGAKTYRNKITLSPIGTDLDPYSLRHAYCTNLAFAGIAEVVAMRWMGHSDPNMVRTIYADAANTKLLRRSIDLLNGQSNTTSNTTAQNRS